MLTCPILTEVASSGKRIKDRKVFAQQHRMILGCMCQKFIARSSVRVELLIIAVKLRFISMSKPPNVPHFASSFRIRRDPGVTRTLWSTPPSICRSSELFSNARVESSCLVAARRCLGLEGQAQPKKILMYKNVRVIFIRLRNAV